MTEYRPPSLTHRSLATTIRALAQQRRQELSACNLVQISTFKESIRAHQTWACSKPATSQIVFTTQENKGKGGLNDDRELDFEHLLHLRCTMSCSDSVFKLQVHFITVPSLTFSHTLPMTLSRPARNWMIRRICSSRSYKLISFLNVPHHQ